MLFVVGFARTTHSPNAQGKKSLQTDKILLSQLIQNQMKKIFYFLTVLCLFLSCHKGEDITPIMGECTDNFPANMNFFEIDNHFPKNYPVSVTYNPLNSNEWIVSLQNRSKKTGAISTEVYVYNTHKKRKYRLIENVFCGSNISNDGWIAFSKDEAIWKIKTDGTGLTQLTNFSACDLNWNPDASILNVFVDGELRMIRNGVMQAFRDVYHLSDHFSQGSWDNTGTKIILKSGDTNGPYLALYDTVSQTYTKLPTDDNTSMKWLQDSKSVLLYNRQGISIMDIYTLEPTLIREKCRSRIYSSLNQSPDGTKLIGVRNDSKYIKENIFELDIYVIEMNTDGTNERRINID